MICKMNGKIKTTDDLLMNNYISIVSSLCKMTTTPAQLESLKIKFKNDIDSVRSYEAVSNLEELIRVLERRNVLSVVKVTPLFHIADFFSSDRRLGLMLNYHAQILSKNPVKKEDFFNMCLMTDFSPVLPEAAVSYISCKVGSYWRQLAMCLHLQEEIIDKIDNSYIKNEEKTRQVIQNYFNGAKLQRLGKPYAILLRALEEIRRRDVKEKVEELLNSHMKEEFL